VGGTLRSARLGATAPRCGAILVIMALGLGPLIVSAPAGAVETRLAPDADARVEQANPDNNYGASSRLVADLSPVTEAYLRFTVPALSGTITKATLRLRVENSTGNGPKVRATASEWAESTLTWNNRPGPGTLGSGGRPRRRNRGNAMAMPINTAPAATPRI